MPLAARIPALLALALLLLPCPARAWQVGGSTSRVHCLKALDGDSLLVEASGADYEVRLIGLDAPEHGQEWGEKARDYLRGLCRANFDLVLEYDRDPRDKYKRTLAYVWTESGAMLNELVLEAGLAVPLAIEPNTKHRERLERASARARKEGNGFWKQGGLRQTPRQWRKDHPRR